MKKRLNFGVLIFLVLTFAGCSSKARLEQILSSIFPPNSEITINATCVKLLGPAVVLFTLKSPLSEEAILNQTVIDNWKRRGTWVRLNSFLDFASKDANEYQGVGVGGTLLDGKDCLRAKTERADAILFEDNRGLYYRSGNREIVAVLFDDPAANGVMFLQSP